MSSCGSAARSARTTVSPPRPESNTPSGARSAVAAVRAGLSPRAAGSPQRHDACARARARAPPCAPRRPPRPDRGSRCASPSAMRVSSSTPRLIGPGCITMASGFARASIAALSPKVRAYSRVVDIIAPREALGLDAQHHHDVGALDRRLEARHDRARRRRASRRAIGIIVLRRAEADLGALLPEEDGVRARDARVRDVTADRDDEAVELALRAAHR